MKAIYKGRLFAVGDNLNYCDLLDWETGEHVIYVSYGDPDLIVDPTDDELEGPWNEELKRLEGGKE